jgi:hypothetical protein
MARRCGDPARFAITYVKFIFISVDILYNNALGDVLDVQVEEIQLI